MLGAKHEGQVSKTSIPAFFNLGFLHYSYAMKPLFCQWKIEYLPVKNWVSRIHLVQIPAQVMQPVNLNFVLNEVAD